MFVLFLVKEFNKICYCFLKGRLESLSWVIYWYGYYVVEDVFIIYYVVRYRIDEFISLFYDGVILECWLWCFYCYSVSFYYVMMLVVYVLLFVVSWFVVIDVF